ncbi:unnamed protein product [Choristocarpus tenellus]
MEDFWPVSRWIIAAMLAGLMSFDGMRKKSLDMTGGWAAFFVGFTSLGISLRLGFTMILFYKSSSVLTKCGSDVKRKIADDFKEGGQRGAVQVLSCSLFATLLAVLRRLVTGMGDNSVDFSSEAIGSALLCSILGFYACCTGDTWSSEIGVLSKSPPRLITNLLRVVPPGTNGGLSWLGTLGAAAGGLFIGAALLLMGWIFQIPPPMSGGLGDEGDFPDLVSQTPLLLLGTLSGLAGSVLDSLMGATLQVSYYDRERKCIVNHLANVNGSAPTQQVEVLCGEDVLTNEQVNAISVRERERERDRKGSRK